MLHFGFSSESRKYAQTYFSLNRSYERLEHRESHQNNPKFQTKCNGENKTKLPRCEIVSGRGRVKRVSQCERSDPAVTKTQYRTVSHGIEQYRTVSHGIALTAADETPSAVEIEAPRGAASKHLSKLQSMKMKLW